MITIKQTMTPFNLYNNRISDKKLIFTSFCIKALSETAVTSSLCPRVRSTVGAVPTTNSRNKEYCPKCLSNEDILRYDIT